MKPDLVIVIAMTLGSISAQTMNVGPAQGSVTDDQGKPLSGAKISYRRIGQLVGPASHPVPAAGEIPTQGLALSDSAGLYRLPTVPVGDYLLCGTVPSGPYLDPCKWQSAIHVNVGNASVSAPTVALRKGVFLNVQINDPSGLLPKVVDRLFQAGNLVVGIKFAQGAYLGAENMTLDATGRSYQMAIPAGVPLSLWLFSRGISITDSTGKSVAPNGATIPFQAVAGQNQTFIFTVMP